MSENLIYEMYPQTNSIKSLRQDEHLYNLYWKKQYYIICFDLSLP